MVDVADGRGSRWRHAARVPPRTPAVRARRQGRYVVALWHPSDEVINVSISDDAGRTWRAAPPLTTQARPDRPHLAVVDGTFVALDVRSNGSTGGSRLQIDTSRDGQRWTGGTIVSNGLAATEGVLDVSGGTWRLLYAACPGIVDCVTPPRVWYRESRDGSSLD